MSEPALVSPMGWQRHPGALVCDVIVATDSSGDFMGTPAWKALLEWLAFHGIDPKSVPAQTLITRRVAECQIVYTRIQQDEHGRPCYHLPEGRFIVTTEVEQGEAPPMPWPSALYAPNGERQA